MAKLSFTKLNAKLDTGFENLIIDDQNIEIKHYLPISKKMEIVNEIVNKSVAKNPNYYNPGEIEVDQVLAIIENYTNLSFTDKQKEEYTKTYDLLVSSGIAKKIICRINDEELNVIELLLTQSLKNVYKYNNSIFSFIQMMSQTNTGVQELQKLFSNNDLSWLKEVMANLG